MINPLRIIFVDPTTKLIAPSAHNLFTSSVKSKKSALLGDIYTKFIDQSAMFTSIVVHIRMSPRCKLNRLSIDQQKQRKKQTNVVRVRIVVYRPVRPWNSSLETVQSALCVIYSNKSRKCLKVCARARSFVRLCVCVCVVNVGVVRQMWYNSALNTHSPRNFTRRNSIDEILVYTQSTPIFPCAGLWITADRLSTKTKVFDYSVQCTLTLNHRFFCRTRSRLCVINTIAVDQENSSIKSV